MADKSTGAYQTILNDASVCQETQDSNNPGNSGATAGEHFQNAGQEGPGNATENEYDRQRNQANNSQDNVGGNSGATAEANMQNAGTEGSRLDVENGEIVYQILRNRVSDGQDNVDGAAGGHERQNGMNGDFDNFITAPEEPTVRSGGIGDDENEMINGQNAYQHYSGVVINLGEQSRILEFIPPELYDDLDEPDLPHI